MITRITHLTVFVHDQDKALEFYTKKFGFKVHTDAQFGAERWLTVCPAEQPDFEIYLARAVTPTQTALVGKQGDIVPLFCLKTDHCMGTYQEFVNAGVRIAQEPQEYEWGTSFICKDIAGNLVNVTQ